MESIALFSLLATFLYKLSQLTLFHLEWGVLHLEFKNRKGETWVKQGVRSKLRRKGPPNR